VSCQIKYTPVATVITLAFSWGPENFKPYWAGRVHDNLSTSGAVRERVVENLDILMDVPMPHLLVGGTLDDWGAFEAFALAGGGFQFYPDSSQPTIYYNCVAEDSDFAPVRGGPKKYSAIMKFRILNDAQAPTSPTQILRRYYGYTS